MLKFILLSIFLLFIFKLELDNILVWVFSLIERVEYVFLLLLIKKMCSNFFCQVRGSWVRMTGLSVFSCDIVSYAFFMFLQCPPWIKTTYRNIRMTRKNYNRCLKVFEPNKYVANRCDMTSSSLTLTCETAKPVWGITARVTSLNFCEKKRTRVVLIQLIKLYKCYKHCVFLIVLIVLS